MHRFCRLSLVSSLMEIPHLPFKMTTWTMRMKWWSNSEVRVSHPYATYQLMKEPESQFVVSFSWIKVVKRSQATTLSRWKRKDLCLSLEIQKSWLEFMESKEGKIISRLSASLWKPLRKAQMLNGGDHAAIRRPLKISIYLFSEY